LLPHRLEYILRNAAAAEHIERLAYYDTLTGLPNRRRCVDLLGAMFAEAERGRESVAVVYLDLNNFKRVNDTFGHSVGDEVLLTVASRLMSTLATFAARHHDVLVSRFATRWRARWGSRSRPLAATHLSSRSFTTRSSSTRPRASGSPYTPTTAP